MRVVHIITGLSTGGAETVLCRLLPGLRQAGFDGHVVSLTDAGSLGARIEAMGVPVRALRLRRSTPDPVALLRLARLLRFLEPDLIQTWMYHADLLGGLASWLAGNRFVVWNLRQSSLDPRLIRRRTLLAARACARLSRWLPEHIVCGSQAAHRAHAGIGYAEDKMVVIPNGVDLAEFRPDADARSSVRRELAVPDDAPLVGMVARWDPQKDHHNFIQAAERLHRVIPQAHFLLCGDGISLENGRLKEWIDAAGIRDRAHLLGRRVDVPRLMASMDIASLSSLYGEGFPNVVAEAMACAAPCVVTDVGDSALIVGDTGRVVPSSDPQALARAWEALLRLERAARAELGEAARRRVEELYSLPMMVSRYRQLYEEILAR